MRAKKKLPSEALAGEEGSSKTILQRYVVAKRNTQNILNFAPSWAGEMVGQVGDCWSWWKLRYYPPYWGESEVCQAVMGYSCKRYKLCQCCAIRRQTKVYHEIRAKVAALGLAPSDMHLVTITLKSSRQLGAMLQQLRDFYQSLRKERKNSVQRETYNALKNPWACLEGWIGRIEITHTASGWHPHFHFLVVPRPECKRLFAFCKHPHPYGDGSGWWGSEWAAALGRRLSAYTLGESYIVHSEQVEDSENAIAEVSKYLFKFGGMPPAKVWEAHRLTQGKRLSNCGGCFFGLNLEPDDLLDHDADDSRPFWDFICRWDGLDYQYTQSGFYTPQNGEEVA